MIDTILSYIKNIFKEHRRPVRGNDTGLFDPYLPISSLKEVESATENPAIYQNDSFAEAGTKQRTFALLRSVIIVIGVVLLFRLVFLQISQGQENYSLAEGNRLKSESLPAPRGLLYDRNGVPLVENVPNFAVILHVSEWPKKSIEQEQLANTIANELGISSQEIISLIKRNDPKLSETVTLLDGINRDTALSLELKLNGINGIELIKSPTRQYSSLPSLGQIAGYIGKATQNDLQDRSDLLSTSFVGKTGLEKQYDTYLQGSPGIETLEVDSRGHIIRSVGIKPALVGQSLLLSIDSSLQQVTANALQDSIVKNNAHSGAAVVFDVKTGDILSIVSVPYFDNNIFANTTDQAKRAQVLQDPLSPLINRAISGQYPSGSTIKPFIASAALAENVIKSDTKIDTSAGKIVIGQNTYVDWKVHTGLYDVKRAIAESNNIFFYTVGGGFNNFLGLGVDRIDKYLQKFGFGQKTGIDLPGEQNGLVPTVSWKKKIKNESWYLGDTYNLSIGQGDLLVTPLQMARATAAVANGGKLLQPRVVRSILNPADKSQQDLPVVTSDSQVVDDSILETVREGMRQTVTAGSARSTFPNFPIDIAAKTGTAQFNPSKDKTHSWFTAFAPYENPQIAVAVIVEGGGEGYVVAAPVARNILEQYFHLPLTPIVPAPANAQ